MDSQKDSQPAYITEKSVAIFNYNENKQIRLYARCMVRFFECHTDTYTQHQPSKTTHEQAFIVLLDNSILAVYACILLCVWCPSDNAVFSPSSTCHIDIVPINTTKIIYSFYVLAAYEQRILPSLGVIYARKYDRQVSNHPAIEQFPLDSIRLDSWNNHNLL